MRTLRLQLAALLALSGAAPAALAQGANDVPAQAAPAPDAASFDVDTYTCQNVLDDLAAGRQSQIGIAVVVTYAQLRAATTPQDHRFTMAAIQRIATASGAACASGDHKRLLRDVVAAQMARLKSGG